MSEFLQVDGKQFRDLDHDGELSPFEDWRLPAADRARDLVQRLNLSEKVGLMLHGTLPANHSSLGVLGYGTEYDLEAVSDLILERGVNSMITRLPVSPRNLAQQNNAIQAVAAKGRFGIPVTISTDPRHHFNPVLGASVAASGFSQWPGTLGLAASRDAGLVRRFGDVVRQEYRATGITMALSPQADLATSPRWGRIDGTFGEDPGLVSILVGAYVEGIQGGPAGICDTGVAAIVKHWVGYGAAKDGFDGHNYYGRYSNFPAGAFEKHVEAFIGAFDKQVAGVMPTYNILLDLMRKGALIEQVGAGYSRELLEDMLRQQYRYGGLILSDWAIAKDVNDACRYGEPPMQPTDISMAWGVESLSLSERFAKGINAGLDQYGGEDTPEPILQAVSDGFVSESRIEQSAERVLEQKFALGLFDNPFVDEEGAAELVGNASFTREADTAQRQSMVFLKRMTSPVTNDKFYLHGISREIFEAADIEVVDNLEIATMGVIKMQSPSQQLHPNFFFGARQKEGDLDFKEDDEAYLALTEIAEKVPTIVIIEMDRPAILTNILEKSHAIIATFGVSDAAVADVLKNPALAIGRLPYALSASMDSVLAQSPDQPLDDPSPLFEAGYSANP